MKLAAQTTSSLLNEISYLGEEIQHFTLLCEQRFVENRTKEIEEEIALLEAKKAKVLENAAKAPATLASLKHQLQKAKEELKKREEEKEKRKNGVPRKASTSSSSTRNEKLEAAYEKMPQVLKNNFSSKADAISFLKELL